MQCQRCEGTGVCPTCRGTGRSGYFLLQPPSWTPKCCAAMEMQAAQFAKARVRCLTRSLDHCPYFPVQTYVHLGGSVHGGRLGDFSAFQD